MNKSIKWIAVTVVCAAVFAGVYFLYGALKESYAPDQFADFSGTPPKGEETEKKEPSAETAEGIGDEETVITETGSAETEEPHKEPEETVDYSAPDFTVYDEDGNPVQLSDFFGKPIVLNFWASWCYYCKEEMPDFNAAYLANPDIQFLMINVTDGSSETVESGKRYVESMGFEFPVFYDTTLMASMTYGARGLPITFFIDKNGDLYTYASGMLTAEALARGIELIR